MPLAEMPYRVVHAIAVVATGKAFPNARKIIQKAVTSDDGTLFVQTLEFVPSELGDIRAWGVRPSYAVARAIGGDAPDLVVTFVLMMMGRPYAFKALDQYVVLTEAMEAVIFNLQHADFSYKLPDYVDKKKATSTTGFWRGGTCFRIRKGRRSGPAWPRRCNRWRSTGVTTAVWTRR